MAVPGEKLDMPMAPALTDPVTISDPGTPMAEFRDALALYVLWAGIAGFSVLVGATMLAQRGAVVLLFGIAATNALFLLIARSPATDRPPQVTVTLAQSVMGITWTTLFAFMSAGPGELVLGMYLSAVLFGVLHVGSGAAAQLAIFATVSYAGVVTVKAFFTDSDFPVWADVSTVLVLAGVMGALLWHASRFARAVDVSEKIERAADALRAPGRPLANEVSHHPYVLNSLEREKGRTDRTNQPFSICVFDVDDIHRFIRESGRGVADLVLQRFARRASGELRAMDGINPAGYQRSFGRVGDEKYIVILPLTNRDGATRCAERIRAAIEKYPIDGRYPVTVSAGVVEYRRGESAMSLLDRAHGALCEAQGAGGNCVVTRGATESFDADVIRLRGPAI